MNALWFLLLLTTTIAALLISKHTVRLYFVAQLVNVLAVAVASNVASSKVYLAVYIITTIPVLECCAFLLWENMPTTKQFLIALDFGLLMGVLGAYSARGWDAGTYVTFIEAILLSILGLAMSQVSMAAKDWQPVRTIGTLSLMLSCYDFAFVRGWRDLNSWLPAAFCTVAFGFLALRSYESSRPGYARP